MARSEPAWGPSEARAEKSWSPPFRFIVAGQFDGHSLRAGELLLAPLGPAVPHGIHHEPIASTSTPASSFTAARTLRARKTKQERNEIVNLVTALLSDATSNAMTYAWSLPTCCPFPFPSTAAYLSPALPTAYLAALYGNSTPLEWGQLLLRATESELRGIVLPLIEFDLKWRTGIPDALTGGTSIALPELELQELQRRVRESAEDWTTGLLGTLELVDTFLQSTLCLALLLHPSAPPSKRRDPQRRAATLDPELLLDFLTDRLQIWSLMQAVKPPTLDRVIQHEHDLVQQWWLDTIVPLFLHRLPSEILSHHRAKLFPAETIVQSLSTRLVPAPSPFKIKDRSLLSLDKSARRKSWAEHNGVTESPTMKRLLTRSGSGGAPLEELNPVVVVVGGGGGGGGPEIFKLPSQRRRSTLPTLPPLPQVIDLPTVSARQPRKQARPLPRGDERLSFSSSSSSSKALFNRREVSISRKVAVPFHGKNLASERTRDKSKDKQEFEESRQRGTKRKSISPRSPSLPPLPFPRED